MTGVLVLCGGDALSEPLGIGEVAIGAGAGVVDTLGAGVVSAGVAGSVDEEDGVVVVVVVVDGVVVCVVVCGVDVPADVSDGVLCE